MRTWAMVGLLALAACAGGPVFIDQIENGEAVLIDPSGHVEHVPAASLPADAGEGSWLGAPPSALAPGRIAALRHRLAHGDDGRDLSLP